MATEPLPDPCSWPAGDCCFTDEMQRLRAEVDAFREDAANYYRVAKEADAQQAALRARVAELEADAARWRMLRRQEGVSVSMTYDGNTGATTWMTGDELDQWADDERNAVNKEGTPE